jgi:hypothetical protein
MLRMCGRYSAKSASCLTEATFDFVTSIVPASTKCGTAWPLLIFSATWIVTDRSDRSRDCA